ncbi:MAG: acyl carrier protein [Candidatus Omnitrophota bacterium]|nr:acyl carrier protein [Candidatus Omnitrophota bacterium]
MTEDRLCRVLAEVFGVPAEQINEDSSPDTIENWDSASHINMILSLESEFDVKLTPEHAMEMLSVKLIRMILEELGVKDFK